ncbi:EamA family transporter [Massilia eurypsychrophila]|jgi:drug/metabolite transporter (DMT)-like permease|uniref:EamA family transporter n=1 Tax=Massilia eurypsychrophila TaxID=1485217 RepID=A0A2G8TK92_9BURK|nr:DMT family transporter [Massilia eurypsychrophila]PIL46463.1 EamA family transporter [Massilia eurypsychrophila]
MQQGVLYALMAAILFGASAPFAKNLLGATPPIMLAALLYLGSGIGLIAWYGARALAGKSAGARADRLTARDWPWLMGATLFGGIMGPIMLMAGLASTAASTASLLLNTEGVFTAALAWFVFKENFDRRIFIGMLLIVAGSVVLNWPSGPLGGVPWSGLAILGACLCWGIDNNLTRKISASDAVQIAAVKGLVAGSVNLVLAFTLGQALPPVATTLVAALLGFCSYGLSLVLFVLALRHLGTARTGAYFAVGPFIGVALSLVLLGETPGAAFWLAAVLMAAGIWLHLTERHEHAHTHEPMEHGHAHRHDRHHQHEHEDGWDGAEPHTHAHAHTELRHGHAHTPDIHHRHGH